jgi:hypothetical protein
MVTKLRIALRFSQKNENSYAEKENAHNDGERNQGSFFGNSGQKDCFFEIKQDRNYEKNRVWK